MDRKKIDGEWENSKGGNEEKELTKWQGMEGESN